MGFSGVLIMIRCGMVVWLSGLSWGILERMAGYGGKKRFGLIWVA